jgi:hypothetical protein
MAAVVVMLFFVLFMWIVIKAGSTGASTGGYAKLVAKGTPARGILLGVTNTPVSTVGVGLNKIQLRAVRIDIEVAGQTPYEASVIALIPLNLVRDVLPGATVEIRISRANSANIAIVGPGVGFNSAALMTQGQINQGAA